MRNDVGKIVASIYQEIRSANEQAAIQNVERIYTLHPMLKMIDQEITTENASIAIRIIYDGKPYFDSPQKEELVARRNAYMSENNIDKNFDMPVYTCKNCNDTGFLNNDKKKICQCYNSKIIPILLEKSNFKNIMNYSFDEFRLDIFSNNQDSTHYNSPNSPQIQMQGILSVAKQFVADFDSKTTKSLFFMGRPGTGKTFLSGCIANELLQTGHSVLYLSAPELFDMITEFRMLSNSFSPEPIRYEKASKLYQSVLTCDLLILDDLGTETVNANRQPELLNILNHRSDSNSKMIISTNVDIKALSLLYDERVMSRIFGGFTVLKFFGDDLRHVKRY